MGGLEAAVPNFAIHRLCKSPLIHGWVVLFMNNTQLNVSMSRSVRLGSMHDVHTVGFGIQRNSHCL